MNDAIATPKPPFAGNCSRCGPTTFEPTDALGLVSCIICGLIVRRYNGPLPSWLDRGAMSDEGKRKLAAAVTAKSVLDERTIVPAEADLGAMDGAHI